MKTSSDPIRVLLVEDDPASRAALAEYLREAGYEVGVAEDGEEVMPYVTRWRPDVVVMDLVLPRMNGFDTARRLRADGDTGTIPLIAVTASWLGSKPEWLLEIGFDSALRKPFTPLELIEEITRVLNPPIDSEQYLEGYGFSVATDPEPIQDRST